MDSQDMSEPPSESAAFASASGGGRDALSLLSADHRRMEALVAEYQAAEDAIGKVMASESLAIAATIHAQIEEEIFYPALRDAGVRAALIDDAVVEHMAAKQLITDVESASVEDQLLDARVRILGQQLMEHARKEEQELFDLARNALDLDAVGARLSARRQELCRQAALNLKSRLRAAGGPASQLAAGQPSDSTTAMPGPLRAVGALADAALSIAPGGARLRNLLDPSRARQ